MCAADFEIRPPPPYENPELDLPPPRPPSPKMNRLSKSPSRSKESTTLQTLAGFNYTHKPLPHLIPFPFQPETPKEKPKYYGTVPKPSKFIKGSMYHSDYESDLECSIPAKWRSYNSDTEEGSKVGRYRKVKLKLPKENEKSESERKPSPPCPHKWESHEDIEKLEEQLRNKRSDFLEQVALLKSAKLSNTLEKKVTTTSSSESKRYSKTYMESSYHASKALRSSFVDKQKNELVLNDKAPKFEAVNFQTHKNQDGTTHHVMDISDGSTLLDEMKADIPSNSNTQQAAKDTCVENTLNIKKENYEHTISHHSLNKSFDSSKTAYEAKSFTAGKDTKNTNITQTLPYIYSEATSKRKPLATGNILPSLCDFDKEIQKANEESCHEQNITKNFNQHSATVSEVKSGATIDSIINNSQTASYPKVETIVNPSPPPPLPAKMRYNAITPSQSSSSQQTMSSNIMDNNSISDEQSHSSQSTCIVREEFVSVKEKIKMLEQKVEEQDYIENDVENEISNEERYTSDVTTSSERQTPTTPTTPKIKPYDIPGAVRILPPSSSSPITCKFNSSSLKKARRSNSVEQHRLFSKDSPIGSPLTLPRSAQQSPLGGYSPFFRKLSCEYSSGTQSQHEVLDQEALAETITKIDGVSKDTDRNPNFNLGKSENGDNKLKAFKEKLIHDTLLSPITVDPGDLIAHDIELQRQNKKSTTVISGEHQEVDQTGKRLVDMTPPPRPPLPNELQGYGLTQSSSGEQLHTYRYSDTEFASSSMTELAYSSTSMERPSATSGESKANNGESLVSVEKSSNGNVISFTKKNKTHNVFTSKTMLYGDKAIGEKYGVTDSELESDPNHNILGIDDSFVRKRQNRSPRQNTPTPDQNQKQSPKLNRASTRTSRKDSSRLDMDGYEADTDDTLSRARRRSVKDLAKSFQEAENACPSPQPFRPKFMHDGSDYEASDFEYQSRFVPSMNISEMHNSYT